MAMVPAPTSATVRLGTTTLCAVVRDNIETLYAVGGMRLEGAAPPPFVRREFDGCLECGLLCRGFARLNARRAPSKHLVALSYGDRRSEWVLQSDADESSVRAPVRGEAVDVAARCCQRRNASYASFLFTLSSTGL